MVRKQELEVTFHFATVLSVTVPILYRIVEVRFNVYILNRKL